MTLISFNLASLAAREVGFTVEGDISTQWAPASDATEEAFCRIDSFSARFDRLLDHVHDRGFDLVDVWLSQLHWRWATAEHVTAALEALRLREMRAVSLAGDFGDTIDEFEQACSLADALGCRLLAGGTRLLETDPEGLESVLARHRLVFGYENHPDRSAAETLARLRGCDPDLVGVAVDTGWYASQGCDVPATLDELGDRIAYVHLKDVLAVGGHEPCRFGEGIVPIQACVRVLLRLGYAAPFSIEQNSGSFDPTDDIAASRDLLVGWLGAGASARAGISGP